MVSHLVDNEDPVKVCGQERARIQPVLKEDWSGVGGGELWLGAAWGIFLEVIKAWTRMIVVGTGRGNSPMRWSLGYRGALVPEEAGVSSLGMWENMEEKEPAHRAGWGGNLRCALWTLGLQGAAASTPSGFSRVGRVVSDHDGGEDQGRSVASIWLHSQTFLLWWALFWVLGFRMTQGQVTASLELFFFSWTSKLGQILGQSAKSQLSFTSYHSQCGTI